jgi:tRNA 2-selenouridine synthase
VLDLEALASHRSSVLGHIPGQPQPSQKRFDSMVWSALRGFEAERVVYVESESKKVGNVRVPDALIDAMRASPCVDLRLSNEERVALLLEDYDFFVKDPTSFCSRLEALSELRGKDVVAGWIEKVKGGHTPEVVLELLTRHYDPMYAQSIGRNFKQFPQALPCELRDRSAESLNEAARSLIASEKPA